MSINDVKWKSPTDFPKPYVKVLARVRYLQPGKRHISLAVLSRRMDDWVETDGTQLQTYVPGFGYEVLGWMSLQDAGQALDFVSRANNTLDEFR